MRNYFVTVVAVFCVLFLNSLAQAQSKVAPFVGFWSINTEKTNFAKDLPQQLKDYKMAISEDQDRLMVKAQVVGTVDVRAAGGQKAQDTISTNSDSRTSKAGSYGVSSTTSTSTEGTTGAVSYGGTLALRFTAAETTYDLTGKEIKIEPAAGDKLNGTTRLRAKVGKDGRSVEMTIFRQMKGARGEFEVVTRESWKLSDDGQTLKFHRSVETPSARDEINLVLSKPAP